MLRHYTRLCLRFLIEISGYYAIKTLLFDLNLEVGITRNTLQRFAFYITVVVNCYVEQNSDEIEDEID